MLTKRYDPYEIQALYKQHPPLMSNAHFKLIVYKERQPGNFDPILNSEELSLLNSQVGKDDASLHPVPIAPVFIKSNATAYHLAFYHWEKCRCRDCKESSVLKYCVELGFRVHTVSR